MTSVCGSTCVRPLEARAVPSVGGDGRSNRYQPSPSTCGVEVPLSGPLWDSPPTGYGETA
jgi:hypothetical protein